jgi:hypothetical protein
MLNSLKISLVLIPIAFLLVVGIYIYSLWATERKRAAEIPVEAVGAMMRDLLSFHEKRGGFPLTLKQLEGVVWEKKHDRNFSNDYRALSHRNYYYLYTRVSNHKFTLWAVPTGKSREEAPTWFLSASPNISLRWKGAAIPIDQVDRIKTSPSLKDLGSLGLIEQPQIDLGNTNKPSFLPVPSR